MRLELSRPARHGGHRQLYFTTAVALGAFSTSQLLFNYSPQSGNFITYLPDRSRALNAVD